MEQDTELEEGAVFSQPRWGPATRDLNSTWGSTFGCIKPQPGLLTHLPLTQAATGCLQCSMPTAKEQQQPAVGNWALKDGHTQSDTWKITAPSPSLALAETNVQWWDIAWGTGFCSIQCWAVPGTFTYRAVCLSFSISKLECWTCPTCGRVKGTAQHPERIRNAEVPTPELQGLSAHALSVLPPVPVLLSTWHHSDWREKSCPSLRAAAHPALHSCIQLQQ